MTQNGNLDMTLDSEDAVKKKLGISSFRELSKDKMLAFAATMPEMANEVRLKLIDQIPGFQKFALDAVNVVERTFEKTLESNSESRRDVHQAFGDVRDVLKGELDKDDISEDHRKFLVEQLMKTSEVEAEKDTENKTFHSEQADGTRMVVLAVAGIALVAAVVLAGGQVIVASGNDDDDA